MKLRNVFFSAFVMAAALVGCKPAEEDLGDPRIELSTEKIEMTQDAGSSSITLVSTRAWRATDLVDWVAVDPQKGEASLKDQAVTINVLANSGNDRSATITFTCGIEKTYLTISQKGAQGAVDEGKGTLESPYMASKAYAVVSAMAAGVETADFFYIKGKVSKIKSIDTASYGNANFYISDDGVSGDTDFYCFQVMYLGGEKFKSEDQLKVGDEVVVKAKLVNYSGNTPETVGKGSGSIVSLNGQTSGGGSVTPDTDYENAPAKTVAEFISAADENTYFKLTGKVSGFNSQYCSFDLTDESGKIYVYSVDNKADWSSKVSNGGTVTLAGKYKFYEQKSQHEVVNAVILSFTAGGDTPDVPGDFSSSADKPASASAALAYAKTLADGTEVEAYVKGKISKIDDVSTQYGNATYYISDDGTQNDQFEIYRGYYLDGAKFTSEDQIKVGDEVVVFGKIVNFKGNTPEMTTGSKLIYHNGEAGGENPGENPGGNTGYEDAPAKTVAEFLAAADKNTYYKLSGTVSNYGATYSNFDLTDATGTIYVYSVKNKDDWSGKIHNGGTITIAGKYSYYEKDSKDEVVDAYILSYDASTETPAEDLKHELESGIEWTLGANSYDNTGSGTNCQTATVNGKSVSNLLKLSSSKNAGSATLHIPAGTTKIGFYGCGWAAADITIGGKTVSVKKNAGCTGNAPYDLTLSESDWYEVEVSAGDVEVSCPSRVLLIGVNSL